ncbi:MAG: TonB-dependent receptor plug domain-containing protein [Ramlibacter sp.]
MRRERGLCRMFALAASLSAAAHAQAPDALSLAPVVISASGLALTESALEQHVDVFTRRQLDDHAAESVGEFLVRQAGVMVDRRGRSGGFGSLFMRGADPSHVVVLVDGVRQNDPLSSRGSAVDLNSLSIDDIERIEVVRGNSSVAHGEALAGVVQLFTRTVTTASTRAVVEAGGHGLRAASAGFATPAWRIGASDREDGEPSIGTVRNRAVNFGYGLPLGAATFRIDGRVADGRSRSFPDDSGGVLYAVNRALEASDSESRQLSAAWRQDLAERGELNARVTRFTREGAQDTPRVVAGLRDPFGLPHIVARTDYGRTEAQLDWRGPIATWEVGVGLQSQRETGALDSTIFLGARVPAAFSIARITDSLHAEARRTTGAWSYHLGLRTEATPGQGTRQHPALGVQYQLGPGLGRVGASLSSAAKLPSFYALGHPLVGNPALKPESTRQAEAFYAFDRQDGSRLRVTVFRAQFRQLVDFEPGPPPRLVNRADIRSTGLEFDLSRALGDRFTARAQGTWMNVSNPGGEPLRQRPKQQALLGIEAQVAARWKLTVDVTRIGRRFDSSIPTAGRWLSGYGELQLAATWQGRDWDLYTAVDNALGSRAEEAIGIPVGGRRIRMGLRYHV